MAKLSSLSRFFSVVISGAAVCGVVGCGPRGESHTVDQILTDARSNYQSAAGRIPSETSAALKFLGSSLDRIAGIGGGGDAKVVSEEIANALTDLSGKAGYTVRPAMAEIINQYRTIAAADSAAKVAIGNANLKLLAARTYSLITSELNTTQFKIVS